MKSLTPADARSEWLLELSGRLMILGWYTLAGVAFCVLCGLSVARKGRARETPEPVQRAA